MAAKEERDEAQDRVVNKTLDLIDNLDADQARCLLRCFIIDEENFDPRALATVAKTVRATCYRTGGDYDARCHFPNGEVARLNRKYLLAALAASAASAEAEKVAQQAVENARSTDQSTQTAENTRGTDQSTQTSEKVANVETSTTNEHYNQQMDGAADALAADLGDLEFEKQETRRLIREGHVTINNYYMNKTPEVKPEQKQEPQQQQKQEPQPPKPTRTQSRKQRCAQCNKWYIEKNNVVREDGKGPCRYHTGQISWYEMAQDEAWNCCRRGRNERGCYPAFHIPA